MENPYFRHLSSGVLAPVMGNRTFADRMAMTFYDDIRSFVCQTTPDIVFPETPFEVMESVKEATFMEMLRGFGLDFSELCWSQDQVIEFSEQHLGHLRSLGWLGCFLVKTGRDYFIATLFKATRDDPKPWVDLRDTRNKRVRGGVPLRFVFPRVTLKP